MAKNFKDRWARLTSMSGEEWVDRVRQHATARVDALRYRMGGRFAVGVRADGDRKPARFFFAKGDVDHICALLKQRLPEETEQIVRRADKICEHRFDLLGYEDLDYGAEIDWHCDRVHGKRAPGKPFHQIRYLDFAEAGDAKVTWELNRHQHFLTLAKAYRLTGNEKYAAELFGQWQHWRRENPYPIGINWASSLEVAFRSLSWLWGYFILGESAQPRGFREEWVRALGISGRHIEVYLSTYFSPNTHLLGEAVALFFIGILCPELERSQRWKERGWKIVVQEAERQVQADGLHFEQSIYYHVYALDFFLHARILASLNGVTIPKQFDETLQKMLGALANLSRAGAPPRLGDDDGGRLFDPQRNRPEHMLEPLATGAILYGRSDWKALAGEIREETLWLLGPNGVSEFDRLPQASSDCSSVALECGGLYLMGGRDQQLVIDAGPQGAATAGHGHADALSLCMNSDGQAVLIDPGTCEYVGDGDERGEFRGTPAHNTLCVDGLDQADAQGPFAWTNLPKVRAEQWIRGSAFDLFVGSHNGYARGSSPVIHRRMVFWLKNKFWLVRDLAEGAGKHKLDLYWHLAAELAQANKSELVFSWGNEKALAVVPVQGQGWASEVQQGWWSPVYGRKEASPLLHFSTMASLPAEFVTLMATVAAREAVGELIQVQGKDVVREYRYRRTGEEHCIWFGQPGSSWTAGPWSSDGELLCWSRSGAERQLILVNGSYVSHRGEKILSCEYAVKSCEVTSSQGKTTTISGDGESIVLQRSLESIAVESEGAALASVPSRTEA